MSATPLSSHARPGDGLELEPGKSNRQTSCSECRRLKLKCDKEVPCGSCIRRGCAAICPTGTLRSAGRGKRSVLSDVPELTTIITEMGERIRQLEHAVAGTHDGGGSSSQHPLLSNAPRLPASSAPAQNAEILGSFSVNEAGHAVYFGPTAGTEALFSIEGASGSQSPEREHISFTSVTESFPFSSGQGPNWDPDQALEQLFAHLPLEVRAWSLCGTFYQNGSWTGMPIVQDEAVELLTQIYRPLQSEDQYPPPVTAQQMAVLYLILALGALVDLELPPYSSEADHYFDLACAAMSVRSLFESPTVVTVQTLVLMAMYYAHGGRRFTMDGAWSTISLACSISQTLGLHRESFGSKLSPIASNRCRALFWETYSIETIYGLSVGRPTGTFLSNISCPFPPDEDAATEPFVKIYPGYRKGRWAYTTQITAPIMETFLTTAKPSYETVLDLDQKIRKYMLSAPFESFPSPDDSPAAFIQRNLIPLFSNIMLMYIHSGSFVEAMRDNPVNPLASSYSASFLAGYRSASEIIKADIRNFTNHPMLFTRWWAIWKSLFNAAIIVGTVATRYPSSKMAPHAIVELFTAVDLIEKGAVSSGRARSGLAILQRLRDKAIAGYSQYSGHRITPPPTSDPETEDELEIFAGYTRVVANKVLSHGMPRQPTPPQLERGDPFPPTQWQKDPEGIPQDFDPSIVEYFALPNSSIPFENVKALPQPQRMAPVDDAGFFFTFPPSYAADAVVGSGFQQTPSVAQEMQWADFLQSL
ncbi:fungal-specific transcription factor domain-containing protein [Mycena rosella]|uniref:Fungal-specific transcription factor domain-containing protein n=1 Tax=Mycena rosella TaxID=1033263 RepID=A0AAD7CVD5_MYCRO|nr:fungal-specific transcription factor domain-containing protein [Mycena rosella]